MVQVRCPKCSSLVEGIEGQEALCGNCGFRAVLPVAQPAAPIGSPSSTAPPAPPRTGAPPASKQSLAPSGPVTGAALLALWSYIIGLAGIFTFFLAHLGLPYAFGVAALILGFLAYQRDKKDRRALLGLVFGGVAILGAVLWTFVR